MEAGKTNEQVETWEIRQLCKFNSGSQETLTVILISTSNISFVSFISKLVQRKFHVLIV